MKTAKKLSAREAERMLLCHMVERAAVREVVREKLASIQFEPIHQAIRERIEALAATKPGLTWADLVEAFGGQPEAQKLVSEISFANYDAGDDEEAEVQVNDCLQTLEFEFWQQHLEALKRSIKAGEVPDVTEASKRLIEISKYLEQLGSRIDLRRKNLPISASAAGEEPSPRGT